MGYQCICGRKYINQPSLSRHGKTCPEYQNRKDRSLLVNVAGKETSNDKRPSKRTNYLELLDQLNKIKISEIRAKITFSGFKNTEFVYLLIEREFIKTREPIYKIGKTEVVNKRFVRYPKDSEIIWVLKVANCQDFENKIKTEFKRQFINRLDIGEEYFEGDCDVMKDIIYQIEKENRSTLKNI